MKKYEFVFNCGKDEVLRRLFAGVKKPELFGNDKIYGRLSKDKKYFSMYHGGDFRNSFRPIFSGEFSEDGDNTIITGGWRASLFTMSFLVFVILFLLTVAVILFFKTGFDILSLICVIYVLFSFIGSCVIIAVFGVYIERKKMDKIIRHIEIQQSIINEK